MLGLFAASDVNAARALMADSLGFHIIFALLGVGLPLVVSLLEFWSIQRKDPALREAAKRLSMVAIILVVAGVASGTIIAIQMPLMWPGLVEFGAPIIGLPFMLEGYAFLLEALFLSFYMATWKKYQGYKHWLLGLPVIVGALGAAFFITTVNSWMQQPAGFEGVDATGKLINPDVWAGILNKNTFFMTSHSILSYYLATVLLVLGGYAWQRWRKRPVKADRQLSEFIMVRLASIAVVLSVLVGVIGHFNLQYLAKAQPHKFAAIELVPKTTAHAPYVVGGTLSEDGTKVEGGLRLPGLLSVLTGNSPNTQVPGLDQTPRKDWPNLIINRLFEAKMALVGLMVAVPVLFLGLRWKFKRLAYKKPVLLALIASGPIAVIVVELGWMITEFGRQPYIVRGYVTVEEAFSNNPGVLRWGYIFPALYVLLFIATGLALRLGLRRFDAKKEGK